MSSIFLNREGGLELVISDNKAFRVLTLMVFQMATHWEERRIDTPVPLLPNQSLIPTPLRASMTKREINAALKRLVKRGIISIEITRDGTVATLLNSSVFHLDLDGSMEVAMETRK